jgi:type IV pilus assembly protein PilQ
MDAFPRLALLGACVATGVGLAVCIALSVSEPAPQLKPAPPQLEQSSPVAQPQPTLDLLASASPAPTPSPTQPRVAEEVLAPPVNTSPPERSETKELVSSLLDIVKLQAARNQPAEPEEKRSDDKRGDDKRSAEPPPEPAYLPPVVEDNEKPVAETLPEPVQRTPVVQRDEGDDKLRVSVQNSDIRDVLDLLSQQGDLNILASKNVTGSVSASLSGVDVESALAAILKSTGFIARREGKFLYVGTPEDFQTMDHSLDSVQTRVYRPNYVRAADLNALIAPLLTTGIGKVTVSAPSLVDLPASQTQAGGDMLAGTDVVIARDYERVLLQVDQLVAEVDCRPRQVLIDAMILSVKLGDEFQFGINWQLLKNKANVRLGLGTPPSSLSGVSFANGGLNFGFVDDSLTNLITALETIGETNVVASPRLLCLNKQRAEIQIGSSLGYVSTTVTETSSTQAIQFLDVGTLLRIRPHISGDGTIRMEVHPELSTGTVEVQQGLTLPNKEVTQVTTNVMCQHGSTVIIGGLIREDLQNDTSQIPYFGNLPVLGSLFRQKKEKVNRQEILVLITPRLVDEPVLSQEGAKIGNDFLRRQSVVFDKMSPIGRRHYGMQYLRKAKAAWAAGDGEVALKYANLSIEHDPLNRSAISLRDEIASVVVPDESVHDYLRQGITLGHHPHKDYSKRGSPWKDADQFTPDVQPPDTWTAGSPGKTLRIDPPPAPPASLNHATRPKYDIRK